MLNIWYTVEVSSRYGEHIFEGVALKCSLAWEVYQCAAEIFELMVIESLPANKLGRGTGSGTALG